MAGILDTLLRLLGQGFFFLYNTIGFHNFGLTIIFFTVITKLILLPLTLKSMKSTQEMNALQPEVKRIQEKYKNDKEKQNQEIQKLYKDNNVSCMGGCLPMLLQFPILIALYSVLRRPLTLVVGKSEEVVMNMVNSLPETLQKFVLYTQNTETIEKVSQINELKLIDALSNNPEYLNSSITAGDLINLNFLGLDLGKVPSINPSVIFGPEIGTYLPLLLIPIVGVILTVISQKLMTPPVAKVDDKKKDEKNPMGGMNNMMKYMIPGMTLYFSFVLPASMGLYWSCTYAFQIAQQLVINKRKKEKAEADKQKQLQVPDTDTKKKPEGGNK
ncbi:MAG: YidC/Oxa1 family membrane protein insertase [Clostridia bacterium]